MRERGGEKPRDRDREIDRQRDRHLLHIYTQNTEKRIDRQIKKITKNRETDRNRERQQIDT